VSTAPFTPEYVFPSELSTYGLPSIVEQPDVMNLVHLASLIIDEECGRLDGDGNGSMVYTTWSERILFQTRNRNLVQLSQKPVTAVDANTVAELQALGASGFAASGVNCYDTGVQPNTLISGFTGQLSALLAASGRYGYSRQDQSIAYPDLWAFINPLNLITLFGGPAPFTTIDVTQCDYSVKTGEIWPPAGLQLQRYSEAIFIWNAGFDPRKMPPMIKQVCAALVKNALLKGDGTTALMSYRLAKSGAGGASYPQLLDPTLDRALVPYRNVRAY
jgi:hypothetical protein